MGDIHGAFQALRQCLERAGFEYSRDRLIQLGDVSDGFNQVYDCVEELLSIKHLVAIRGNHDDWLLDFIETGYHPDNWSKGGKGTLQSYLKKVGKDKLIMQVGSGYKSALNPSDIPARHQTFFRNQVLYYIDEGNRCFVHAGFNRHLPFEGQRPALFFWDRNLWSDALSWQCGYRNIFNDDEFRMATEFTEIFLGHSNTLLFNSDKPLKAANIYNLDTGAGHSGRLTIMDVETKAYWQSDPVMELYAEGGR
jgi:serine/threonine protein phosphatase 1